MESLWEAEKKLNDLPHFYYSHFPIKKIFSNAFMYCNSQLYYCNQDSSNLKQLSNLGTMNNAKTAVCEVFVNPFFLS